MKMGYFWTFLACILMAVSIVNARNPFEGFKMNDEGLGKNDKRGVVEYSVCPCGWENVGGGCYKFVKTHVSWDVARTNCQESGGDLVIVSDADKNKFLADSAADHGLLSPWLGYFRPRYQPNKFLSVCGVKPAYTNWWKGEPNDQGGDENCVQMYTPADLRGRWNDIRCTKPLSYICEFNYLRCA